MIHYVCLSFGLKRKKREEILRQSVNFNAFSWNRHRMKGAHETEGQTTKEWLLWLVHPMWLLLWFKIGIKVDIQVFVNCITREN